MPHIIVKWYPGRTKAQKEALAEAITREVVTVAGCAESSVSVAIEEETGRRLSTAPISLERKITWSANRAIIRLSINPDLSGIYVTHQ
jgi:phenylpyruvate tautomerase PptA (4-oxalocrotonate tautomerase family)